MCFTNLNAVHYKYSTSINNYDTSTINNWITDNSNIIFVIIALDNNILSVLKHCFLFFN